MDPFEGEKGAKYPLNANELIYKNEREALVAPFSPIWIGRDFPISRIHSMFR